MSQRLPPISMSDFSLSISTPHYAGGQSLPLCSELFSAQCLCQRRVATPATDVCVCVCLGEREMKSQDVVYSSPLHLRDLKMQMVIFSLSTAFLCGKNVSRVCCFTNALCSRFFTVMGFPLFPFTFCCNYIFLVLQASETDPGLSLNPSVR